MICKTFCKYFPFWYKMAIFVAITLKPNVRMKSIKLAIIALLGFSTACSTVKEGSKSKNNDQKDKKEDVAPSIIVMYGVRRPVDAPADVKKVEPIENQQAPKVSEKPDTPAQK